MSVRAAVTVAIVLSALPTAASAEGPFAPPITLAERAGRADIAMRLDGTTTVAWANPSYIAGETTPGATGVWAATRPPGGLPLGTPEQLYDRPSFSADVATNERGDVAVVWDVAGERPDDPASPDDPAMRLRFRPAGGAWSEVEAPPLPPLQPSRNSANERTRRQTRDPRVAVAPDGTVTVAWHETDYGAETHRAIATVRRPGGTYSAPQAVGENVHYGPVVATDGTGRTMLAWRARDAGAIQVAERAAGDDAVGPPLTLSGSSNAQVPEIAVNARGDAFLTWWGGAAFRPAVGPWSVEPVETFDRTYPLLADDGTAGVVWFAFPPGANLALRPPGGRLDPRGVSNRDVRQPDNEPTGVAFDALGNTVILWRTPEPDRSRAALRASFFSGAAAVPGSVAVSAGAVGEGSEPRLGMDRFGNGLAVWREGPRLVSSAYSATPPAVAGLARSATPGTFRFRLSEPARFELRVRRGRRTVGRQLGFAGAGPTRLALSDELRRRIARPGRYEALLRARDAGRTASRTARLRFRVR